MTSGDRPPRRRISHAQRGVGYLLVLFAVAAIGVGLAGTGAVWHTATQREREAQLLFVGQQFRLALASYRDATPEGMPSAPATLDELLDDRRTAVPRRHLRRLWRDPMTNTADWGLVRVGGRIVGIHSRAERKPLRTAFDVRDAAFAGKGSYTEWVFDAAALPPRAAQAVQASTTGGSP